MAAVVIYDAVASGRTARESDAVSQTDNLQPRVTELSDRYIQDSGRAKTMRRRAVTTHFTSKRFLVDAERQDFDSNLE